MCIGNLKLEKIGLFIVVIIIDIMRGRWASAAIGAGIARNRAAGQAQAQDQAQQTQKPSGQEDVTQKLQKLADLKKQGILSEEEFQKLKMELLAKL
jgi:hypothetical protein